MRAANFKKKENGNWEQALSLDHSPSMNNNNNNNTIQSPSTTDQRRVAQSPIPYGLLKAAPGHSFDVTPSRLSNISPKPLSKPLPRTAEIGALWPTYSISPAELKSKRPHIESEIDQLWKQSPLPKLSVASVFNTPQRRGEDNNNHRNQQDEENSRAVEASLEEEEQQAEAEAKRKEEEAQKLREEESERRRVDEEAKRQEDLLREEYEEQKKKKKNAKATEKQKKEELKRKEEEEKKKKEEEERKKREEEEEEARRKEEEEEKRKEEAKQKKEEEKKKKEEAKRIKAEEAKKKKEEAKLKKEEAKRLKEEEEEKKRKQQEEEEEEKKKKEEENNKEEQEEEEDSKIPESPKGENEEEVDVMEVEDAGEDGIDEKEKLRRQRLSEAAKKRWEKKRLAAEARQRGRKKAAEESTQEPVEDSEEKSPKKENKSPKKGKGKSPKKGKKAESSESEKEEEKEKEENKKEEEEEKEKEEDEEEKEDKLPESPSKVVARRGRRKKRFQLEEPEEKEETKEAEKENEEKEKEKEEEKASSDKETKEAESVTPKRGRPKKSLTPTKPETPKSTEKSPEKETPKKGRGRPKRKPAEESESVPEEPAQSPPASPPPNNKEDITVALSPDNDQISPSKRSFSARRRKPVSSPSLDAVMQTPSHEDLPLDLSQDIAGSPVDIEVDIDDNDEPIAMETIQIEKDVEEEPPAARHKRPRAMKFSQDIFQDIELKEIDPNNNNANNNNNKAPAGTKEFHLNPWWLRSTPVKAEFPLNIGVEGICIIENQKHTYKSTTVRDFVSSRCLLSSSKNRYYLDGEMDEAMSRGHGFNKEVIERFKDGFPEDWKEVLIKYRAVSTTSSVPLETPMEVEPSSPVVEKKTASKKSSTKKKAKTPKKTPTKTPRKSTSPKTPKTPRTTPRKVGELPIKDSSDIIATDTAKTVIELEDTRQAKVIESVSVREHLSEKHGARRLSSGRVSVPPLAFWKGQVIRRDFFGNSVEIVNGSADLTATTPERTIKLPNIKQSKRQRRKSRSASPKKEKETSRKRKVSKSPEVSSEEEKEKKKVKKGDEEEEEEKPKKKTKSKTTKRGRKPKAAATKKKDENNNNKKSKKTIEVEDEESNEEEPRGEDGWTASETQALEKAVHEVDPASAQYWKQVSKLVPGKTPVECQTKYQAKYKTPTTNKTRRKTKEDEEESPLQLGKKGKLFEGRLKDKEKIRNIVKNAQKNHTDDIFETTPVKEATKDIEVELSDDDEIEKKYFKGRGNTPSKQAPKEKESPDLLKKPVNRKEVDSYVNQIKTKAKKAEKNKKTDVFRFDDFDTDKSSRKKDSGSSDLTVIREVTMGKGEEEDDDKPDYYFSDEDNLYT